MKSAIVTGGRSGLGLAISKQLVERGFHVTIFSRTGELKTPSLGSCSFESVLGNVSNEIDVDTLLKRTVDRTGHVDLWVNAAGIWVPPVPVENLAMQKIRNAFEPNVFGLMICCKVALSQMRKQGSGTILNVISTSGLSGRAMLSGYAASKWAARGFTESLRAECVGSSISILAVYPGGMKTAFFDDEVPEDFNEYMDVDKVATQIVENLQNEKLLEDMIIRRSTYIQ